MMVLDGLISAQPSLPDHTDSAHRLMTPPVLLLAGILTLGTTDIRLPAGKRAVSTPPNLCPSTCTRKFPGPINVFNTFLHM
jgi:hypothetical protein